MSLLLKVISKFKFEKFNKEDTIALNRERHKVMMRQAPLMYATLIINMIALVYPHWEHISPLFSIVVPTILISIFIHHSYEEYRNINRVISDDAIKKKLDSTIYKAGAMGIVLTAWAYALFSYNVPIMQLHILFFLIYIIS